VRYANTVAANHVKEDVSEATHSMLNVLIMTDPDQIRKELANTEARSASASAQVAELAKSTGDASMQEQAQRLARAVSVFKLQTTGPGCAGAAPAQSGSGTIATGTIEPDSGCGPNRGQRFSQQRPSYQGDYDAQQ